MLLVLPFMTKRQSISQRRALLLAALFTFSRLCATAVSYGPEWRQGYLLAGAEQRILYQDMGRRKSVCGQPRLDLARWPYGHTAAVSPILSSPQYTVAGNNSCDACLEIAVGTVQVGTFTVQVTDLVGNLSEGAILLSPHASRAVALTLGTQDTRVSVRHRTVACQPPGNLSIHTTVTKGGALTATLLEVAGFGSVNALEVRTSQDGQDGWVGMSEMTGTEYFTSQPPKPPLDFRITQAAGPPLLALCAASHCFSYFTRNS